MKHILALMTFASLGLAMPAFAAQSIVAGTPYIHGDSVPSTPVNRLEFCEHDWTVTTNIHPIGSNGTGWVITQYADNTIRISNGWGSPGWEDVINVSGVASNFVCIRAQIDSTTSYVEGWDKNGVRIFSNQHTFSTVTPSGTGFEVGPGSEQPRSISYVRVHTTILPMNSRPPVTFDNSNLLFWWKFEGDLNDSSGNGYNAVASTTPSYVATTAQTVQAKIKTPNAPTWADVISQRAGHPATIDGSASYSQADASAAVTYFWQQLNGPTPPALTSHTAATTIIPNPAFGDYNIQLQVTDAAGQTGLAAAHIGAVATDANGVVVQADRNADFLFGPMIAFGKNPWSYQDYMHKHGMELRAGLDGKGGAYQALGWRDGIGGHPMWLDKASGTVTYYWNGSGENVGHHTGTGPTGTTLGATLNPADSTITVADASKLDFSDLPTIVEIHNDTVMTGGHELVHVISVSGNTLTIDYDGRGEVCANNIGCATTPTWPSGSAVNQFKLKGTGTHFLTDSVAPVCPLGKGLPGPTYYSTGTISLTHGSTTLTGSGTNWADSFQNIYVGRFLQINATHGGVPFVFVSRITHVTDTTHVTLARTYPADADDLSGLSYKILTAIRSVVTRYPLIVDSRGTGMASWGTRWCQSETEAYLDSIVQGPSVTAGHDNAKDGTLQSGVQFSIVDNILSYMNSGSVGGISFYCESCASRSLYLRSGLAAAKEAAETIEEGWANAPFSNPEVAGGSPLFKGGQGIGSFINAILTNETGVSWPIARTFAAAGEVMVNCMTSVPPTCNYDSRDRGYQAAWLTLAAIFDPDTTTATALQDGTPVTGYRARWQADIATLTASEAAARGADHSWANYGGTFALETPDLTTTNGSAVVTTTSGGTISTSTCSGITTGTGTVTSGSATLTVTSGTVPTGNGATTTIVINRCDSGTCPPVAQPSTTISVPYIGSGGTITLSALWPGTGTAVPVTWMATTSAVPMLAIGKLSNNYIDTRRGYNCIYNSGSQITLDRPWFGVGTDGAGYYGRAGNAGVALSGTGQQPYMLGIDVFRMNALSGAAAFTGDTGLNAASAAYSASTGFTADATQWLRDNAIDPNTGGLYYGRVFGFCEPPTTDSNIFGDSGYRTLACAYAKGVSATVPARQLTAEISNAFGALYTGLPTSPNLLFGNTSYASIWAHSLYDDPSVSSFNDGLSVVQNIGSSNLTDNYLGNGKYYGQVFGMGFSSQWPAVMLGGVAAADPRSYKIPVHLGHIPGAAKVRITVTEPNGLEHSPVVCTGATCTVTADGRQGSHQYRTDYLTAGNVPILPLGRNIRLYVQ